MSQRGVATSLPRSKCILRIGFTRFFHSSDGLDIKHLKMHRKADKAVSRTSFPASEPQLSASSHKSKNNKGHTTFTPFPMRDCSTSGANEYFHSLFSHQPPHSSPTTFFQSNRMLFGKTHVRTLGVRSCPHKLPDSWRHYLSLSSPGTSAPIQPEDKHLDVHQRGLHCGYILHKADWKISGCTQYTCVYPASTPLAIPTCPPHQPPVL